MGNRARVVHVRVRGLGRQLGGRVLRVREIGRSDSVLLQGELRDLGEHRRRDRAAVAEIVLVESHERRKTRFGGRRVPDERRHRRRARVPAGRECRLRGARLARDVVAGNRGTRARAVRDHSLEHLSHQRRGVRRHDAGSLGDRRRMPYAVGVDRRVEKVRRPGDASVGNRREGVEHLHGGHRHAVADRRRILARRVVLRRRKQQAGRLVGPRDGCLGAETERAHRVGHLLVLHTLRDLDRADVRRLPEDVGRRPVLDPARHSRVGFGVDVGSNTFGDRD